MFKKWLKYTIIAILVLGIISSILSIWLPVLQSFRIVFGAVYLLFLPGFVWSWVFWKKDELNVIERLTLSLALSIAIVPLVVFLMNKLGIKINLLNPSIEILGIILLGIIYILLENKLFKRLIKKNE